RINALISEWEIAAPRHQRASYGNERAQEVDIGTLRDGSSKFHELRNGSVVGVHGTSPSRRRCRICRIIRLRFDSFDTLVPIALGPRLHFPPSALLCRYFRRLARCTSRAPFTAPGRLKLTV